MTARTRPGGGVSVGRDSVPLLPLPLGSSMRPAGWAWERGDPLVLLESGPEQPSSAPATPQALAFLETSPQGRACAPPVGPTAELREEMWALGVSVG